MTEYLIHLVQNLPGELAVFILAMIPITELRASIPIGMTIFDLSAFSAFFFSVLGDAIPMFFIIWLLPAISSWSMKKWKTADKFFTWLFARTRKKFEKKYYTYGEIALMIFVAIPLPVTGAWTGAVASFLFGIPKKRSAIFISAGIIIAGIIVTILSISGISIFTNMI